MTGEELRARREKLGMSQAKLAIQLGVSQTTITRWETEARNIEHATILERAMERVEEIEELERQKEERRALARRTRTPEEIAASIAETRAILYAPVIVTLYSPEGDVLGECQGRAGDVPAAVRQLYRQHVGGVIDDEIVRTINGRTASSFGNKHVPSGNIWKVLGTENPYYPWSVRTPDGTPVKA